MAIPNVDEWVDDPDYLRGLIEQAGLSQQMAAKTIGVSTRMMRYYLQANDHETYRVAPYVVQFALEALAKGEP